MNELFLFVRPPRPLWPFNSPATAFWPPLAFASMAAMLREKITDLRVEILDAPALEMGWRTLAAELHRRRPAYVGIGEEAVSCVEGLRLARIAKACQARVVAGGCFFGHVAPQVLSTGLIDVVVHGEGELTIVELVQAWRDSSLANLGQVHGISFSDPTQGGEVMTNAPRAPMPDLDALPMPAYDLLPVHRYGAGSRNHPRLAAIELGRGCFGSCDFCVLWRQMGRFAGEKPVPHLRVKSSARLLEEIKVLVHRYDRGYLGWVDPCFNADPRRPGELAELLLRRGLHLGQSAWARTDALVRDAASGALGACVRAGLNELYLGIERPDPSSLAALHKTSDVGHAREAVRILREQFPEVLAIGSFIYGLPGDSPATVRAIHRLAVDLQLDQFFFIPLTPLPGTSGWRSELWDPTGERFRDFSFLPTGRPHGQFALLEKALLWSLLLSWPQKRRRLWAELLFGSDPRRRRINQRIHARAFRFHLRLLVSLLRGAPGSGLSFPRWYES